MSTVSDGCIEPVVVLDASILQLADFMEFFECNQLLLEVLAVELLEVLITEDSVVLEFPLEHFSDLFRIQMAVSEQVCGVLCRTLEVHFFILHDLNSCLEEPILLRSSDYLAMNLDLWAPCLLCSSNI